MQAIPKENLVPGKEYYLQDFETGYEPPQKPSKMIAKFEKLIESFWNPEFIWACFTDCRKLEYRNDTSYGSRVQLNYKWKFYEIMQDKIQAIKDIFEQEIRPAVQSDGGDVEFIDFKDGVVTIKMHAGCPELHCPFGRQVAMATPDILYPSLQL